MFPHVYLDVGEAINYAGAASTALVSESMELAPFRKLLFSSDAWGAPELHLLGSLLFRRAMSRILGDWVVRGDWSLADADRVVTLIASENAQRVYGLGAA
jgi:predicted TIM-barrel fold metal-dependent hydrolase